MLRELLVVEAEEEPGEHRHDVHGVSGVDEGLEQEDELAQLLLRPGLRPRDLDGHVTFLERAGVEVQVGLLPGEHQEVACRALAAVEPDPDPARKHRRFEAGRVRIAPRLGHLVVENPLRAVGRPRVGHHRREARLAVGFLPGKAGGIVENLVDEVGNGLARAEVGDEPEDRAELPEARAHLVVDGDVRAPEAIDALLRIPDHEERPGTRNHGVPVGRPGGVVGRLRSGIPRSRSGIPRLRLGLGCEQEKQLRLYGIGVLELVDEDVPVAFPQIPAHLGMVAKQLRGQHQEVVEAEQPDAQTLLCELECRPPHQPDRHRIAMRQPAVEMLADRAVFASQDSQVIPQPLDLGRAFRGRLWPAVEREALSRGHLLGGIEERREVVPSAESALVAEGAHHLLGRIPSAFGLIIRNQGQCPVEQFLQHAAHPARLLGPGRGDGIGGILDIEVLDHLVERLAQLVHAQPGARQFLYQGIRVGDDALDEARPEAFLQELALGLLRLLELRVEAGFDGALAEQTRAEGVDGAQKRAVDAVDCVAEPGRPLAFGRIVAGLAVAPLERHLETFPQLRRRLAREGDGRDPGHFRFTALDQRHHPVDEERGLAGAGAGLDQEAGAEFGANALALVFVDGWGSPVRVRAGGFRRAHDDASPDRAWASSACRNPAPSWSQLRIARSPASSGASPMRSFTHSASGEMTPKSVSRTRQIAW